MTSETVQAAQRLLAERERFGLAKYGTTVDRTDLRAGDWLQHAIEEASDLLLYLIRLQQMMPRTPDSERSTLSSLAGIAPDLMPLEYQPAPAPVPEDAERAAYEARWKDAPCRATHVAQDSDGDCYWFTREPYCNGLQWFGGVLSYAGDRLLGSVKCEPRPVQGVEP